MKVIYNHPAIPMVGVKLNTEYDLIVKGEKAVISNGEIKIELTKYQAETMFTKVEEK
jgi:hypothetical protein